MGKRSGVVQDEEAFLRMTLADLDAEVTRCEMRLSVAPTSYLRKSFAKRMQHRRQTIVRQSVPNEHIIEREHVAVVDVGYLASLQRA